MELSGSAFLPGHFSGGAKAADNLRIGDWAVHRASPDAMGKGEKSVPAGICNLFP